MTTVVGTPPGVTASGYRPFPPLPPITALAGHWDAADPTMFTYGTGTQIATWIDKSSNGFTVSGTPNTNLQRNSTINGVTCVRAINGFGLTRANVDVQKWFDPANRTNAMNFGVFQMEGGTYGSYFVHNAASYRMSIAINGGAANYFDFADPIDYAPGGGRLSGTIGVTANTPTLVASYRNGANMAVRVNGVQMLTTSAAGGPGAAASQLATLNMPSIVGGQSFNGRVGEVIAVARYDATDFATIESFLKAKWKIT